MARAGKTPGPAAPVPWQQFVAAFETATGALDRLQAHAAPRPFLADPDAHARGTDPRMLVLHAAVSQLGEDRELLRSFSERFWALIDLVRSGNVAEWMIPAEPIEGEEGEPPPRLHPALLLAAAEVRMTRTRRFPIRRFRERVEEIIRTEGG